MPMPFNADEVFDMAEQIERNGAEFYRAGAEKFPDVSKVLLDLAAMEDEHLKTFIQMRSELSAAEQKPLVFDPDGEAQMYLRVMADGHVFNTKDDPAKLLVDKETAEDVLNMALGVERDTIAFLVGLKESVSRQAGKDKVDAIITEEIGHVATLNEKLTALKNG
ncbi:MAG: ferritin family protein [Phycisphaerales bacterium]|nr:MAG: ferritin family protein [Phycisphaerales bacterium]